MRLFSLGLSALLFWGSIVVSPAEGQYVDLPLDQIIEEEAADVEVCQDFICTKLREEILAEASKCRPLANFKRRRMRVRRARATNSCKIFQDKNFELSKGKCSAAIRDACVRSGIDAKYLAADAFNLHKNGLLEKAGFVNLIWKYNEFNAPLGSILVYVGGASHRYGHVEIRVNPTLYCSDHCNDHPVSGVSTVLKKKYRIVGVYLPFTSSIQISSNQTVPGT